MKILIIANAFTKDNVSGGDKNFIEIARNLIKKNLSITILTNPIGKAVCQKNLADSKLDYILTDQHTTEILNPFSILFWYFKRGFYSIKILKKKKKEFDAVIFSNDFYSDLLGLIALKDKFKIIIFNMLAPNPFLGYSQKLHFPSLSEFHYFFSNLLSFVLINIFTNPKNTKIVATAKNIQDDLKNSILSQKFKNEIKVINYGSDLKDTLQTISVISKKYDFVWIGRNHIQKGIQDLKQILLILQQKKPDFSIQIIGDVDAILKPFINENGLQKNVFLQGKKYDLEKNKIISQCKVFLFTSHFESFGIVVLENLLLKNLVVGYKIKSSLLNFSQNIDFVENFDYKQFTEKALLNLYQYSNKTDLIQKNLDFAKKFTWQNTSNQYYQLLLQNFKK
jgi:glycosyltransferase involved in cell wall biosynthesis